MVSREVDLPAMHITRHLAYCTAVFLQKFWCAWHRRSTCHLEAGRLNTHRQNTRSIYVVQIGRICTMLPLLPQSSLVVAYDKPPYLPRRTDEHYIEMPLLTHSLLGAAKCRRDSCQRGQIQNSP